MVHVVHAGNRNLYRNALSQMYCDRKRIFCDALGWKIPVAAGIFEIDQFDTDDAVYLLDIDPQDDRHLGSTRLLPSTKPHILGSLFPALCDQSVPRGPDIWEITRFCTAPRLRREQTLRARSHLWVALAEFALRYGISRYTCVAEVPWMATLQEYAWRSSPLGEPREINGEALGALIVENSSHSLLDLRVKTGVRETVLESRGAPFAVYPLQDLANAS
ncbi:MAG TPA: acyl-homoserine-lactone synthase [Rhizomicrobium sp.]|jgi:acyl-homoserine lactone synthase|nr:acyl-homoserine-lactone synthase [Rhizomicrobium sp.]